MSDKPSRSGKKTDSPTSGKPSAPRAPRKSTPEMTQDEAFEAETGLTMEEAANAALDQEIERLKAENERLKDPNNPKNRKHNPFYRPGTVEEQLRAGKDRVVRTVTRRTKKELPDA